jgi:hypothetical protein
LADTIKQSVNVEARVYGIPSEQVVGSSIGTRFDMRDGRPILFRLPDMKKDWKRVLAFQ